MLRFWLPPFGIFKLCLFQESVVRTKFDIYVFIAKCMILDILKRADGPRPSFDKS
jgi:hypothetical protein